MGFLGFGRQRPLVGNPNAYGGDHIPALTAAGYRVKHADSDQLRRLIQPWQARSYIDLNVLVVLCGSFGIGAAVGKSGLAKECATLLIDALHQFGAIGIVAGVLVATVVITQLVTNNAAANEPRLPDIIWNYPWRLANP